ncbi:hypothetical protein G5714_014692 [Onychostoma macrolepis]|uniref:Uncharacterized protein n=1 Tax=Onychostoma macrolepis TaxID=369639 RepID=A0A7J6CAR7_9TELE|nr:hypothetical protein G5714_014692 [Onychostoma macrolepis]
MPRTRVSSPFLRRMPPCVTLELGTCTKPGTRRRPVPQTRRAIVSVRAGPAPAAQHLHGMRGVEMARRAPPPWQRPRPPFALALRCHGQACPAPSFGGCRRASLWNWARVQNLARGVALSPKLGERLRQSGRVQPQQPSTCTVCEVSRWLAGPHHLGESSQGREGYRYLERASSLVLAMAAHILKLDRYRED